VLSLSSTGLFPRLLGDVGGTNARFGWQAAPGAALHPVDALACAAHASIEDAIETYLRTYQLPRPLAACIGIANPVTDDQVRMTNHHWSFSITQLQQQLGLQTLQVINDFTALALALPDLPGEACHPVGAPCLGAHSAPLALLGPGTGLGVSGLLPNAGQWLPIAGEGGHVTLAARTAEEFAVLQALQDRYGHVSAERVLSGQGLADLHAIRQQLRTGRPWTDAADAASITQQALQAHEPECLQTLEMFATFLGRVAGDLALTLGARGGVFIGGGIVPRWLGWFEQSSFRAAFEDKGRFSDYLSRIPVWVIRTEHSPALWGAARALDQALGVER
jgi:glucokinase